MTTTITIETRETRDGMTYCDRTQWDVREMPYSILPDIIRMTEERQRRNIEKTIWERHGKNNPTG